MKTISLLVTIAEEDARDIVEYKYDVRDLSHLPEAIARILGMFTAKGAFNETAINVTKIGEYES